MEIPVTGLAVMRSRKVVNHEERSITRLKPEVLGYVLSTNLETHRVTCLMANGVIWSLAELQQMHPDDSVYVRSVEEE